MAQETKVGGELTKTSWEQGVAIRLRLRQSWGLRTLYGHRVRAPPASDGIAEHHRDVLEWPSFHALFAA